MVLKFKAKTYRHERIWSKVWNPSFAPESIRALFLWPMKMILMSNMLQCELSLILAASRFTGFTPSDWDPFLLQVFITLGRTSSHSHTGASVAGSYQLYTTSTCLSKTHTRGQPRSAGTLKRLHRFIKHRLVSLLDLTLSFLEPRTWPKWDFWVKRTRRAGC